MVSFYAPHAVFDIASPGIGTYEGHAAIRGLYEDVNYWDGERALADLRLEGRR